MTAPEFSDAEMIAELERLAAQAERMAEIRAMYDLAPEIDTTRQARLYRAIAARPSATSADWQPPEESERPDGFRCQGWVDRSWEYVIWSRERTPEWRDDYGLPISQPVKFAPLPPTPKTDEVTK